MLTLVGSSDEDEEPLICVPQVYVGVGIKGENKAI